MAAKGRCGDGGLWASREKLQAAPAGRLPGVWREKRPAPKPPSLRCARRARPPCHFLKCWVFAGSLLGFCRARTQQPRLNNRPSKGKRAALEMDADISIHVRSGTGPPGPPATPSRDISISGSLRKAWSRDKNFKFCPGSPGQIACPGIGNAKTPHKLPVPKSTRPHKRASHRMRH